MFDALENNSIQKIEVIKNLISTHQGITDTLPSLERLITKEFYLSSTITKTYAIFENFINTIIADYLDILSEIQEFSKLSSEFHKEYRIGISHILSKLEHKRYQHLTHEDVVKWYYDAIHNNKNYRFVTEALTRQEENYRLQTINLAFIKVDLKNFHSWVSHHPVLEKIFPSPQNKFASLESDLKNFIDLRNEASHRSLENLPGDTSLDEYLDLIIAIIQVISSYFRKSVILLKEDLSLITPLGVITEYFKKHEAYIISCNKDCFINIDSKVLVSTNNNCFLATIESLHDNNISINEVKITSHEYELGIKFNMPIPKGSNIYINYN
ncbi:MAG: HEPN domain-containing protein [Acinetobacter calcoaceticus]